jgi:hypothetical protein
VSGRRSIKMRRGEGVKVDIINTVDIIKIWTWVEEQAHFEPFITSDMPDRCALDVLMDLTSIRRQNYAIVDKLLAENTFRG